MTLPQLAFIEAASRLVHIFITNHRCQGVTVVCDGEGEYPAESDKSEDIMVGHGTERYAIFSRGMWDDSNNFGSSPAPCFFIISSFR